MMQLKLQVIRTAVEQALTPSPGSTAVQPAAEADALAAAAAAVQRRPSNHHGMPRPPLGQEGRASPRDGAWGGGPSADGEVEAEQELVGSPGQQHLQQHLQSVDVRDVQVRGRFLAAEIAGQGGLALGALTAGQLPALLPIVPCWPRERLGPAPRRAVSYSAQTPCTMSYRP